MRNSTECLFDNRIIQEVELAITRYLSASDASVKATWESLAGTGSTSLRSLVIIDLDNKLYRFVVKRFQILDKPEDESRLQAQREFNGLKKLNTIKSNLWHTPYPVSFLEEYSTIIMEYFPGTSLNALFWHHIKRWRFSRRYLPWFLSIMNDVANIILEIQDEKDLNMVLDQADEGWYKLFLDEQLRVLKEYGVQKYLLDAIAIKVKDALPAIVDPHNQCIQHSDLYLNNLLYSSGHYCVVDLPNTCIGTKYWDISHMLSSLEDYKLLRNIDAKIIDTCKSEFLGKFSLEPYLLECMLLIHYCLSFKLSLMTYQGWMKKVIKRRPAEFYHKRISELLGKE